MNVEELQKLLDRFKAEFVGIDPVWFPLYLVVPEEWRDGFMFMNVDVSAGFKIYCYKHGITRRYLCVDAMGNTYSARSKDAIQITHEQALNWVYDNLEGLTDFITGKQATRESAYNTEFKIARQKAMELAGYITVG